MNPDHMTRSCLQANLTHLSEEMTRFAEEYAAAIGRKYKGWTVWCPE